MLFTPKKYGRDWFLSASIITSAASLGFGICAVIGSFSNFEDWSDKIFFVSMFFMGMVVTGALGKAWWKTASEMGPDDRRSN